MRTKAKRKAKRNGKTFVPDFVVDRAAVPGKFKQVVWIVTGMPKPGQHYPLVYGNRLPRIYYRDKYDSRLKGRGKLPYFNEPRDVYRHFFRDGKPVKNAIPCQVDVKLLKVFGFTQREIVDMCLEDFGVGMDEQRRIMAA